MIQQDNLTLQVRVARPTERLWPLTEDGDLPEAPPPWGHPREAGGTLGQLTAELEGERERLVLELEKTKKLLRHSTKRKRIRTRIYNRYRFLLEIKDLQLESLEQVHALAQVHTLG